MDLNVAVSTASELFEDNDMVFPILMGRENLKILASPGSESSGVSSLDSEDAKKLASEQLPTSSSPTLESEPSSAVQTESESSDGSSDADDDKPDEPNAMESVQSSDECESQSDATDDEKDNDDDDDDDLKSKDQESMSENEDVVELEIDTEATATVTATDADTVSVAPQEASIDLDEIRYKNLKIVYDGRDILDFSTNVNNKSWNFQYAHLPEKNYQMYINNRSQYNRLAAGYENPEHYLLNTCGKCAFHFPVLVDMADKADAPMAVNKSSVNVNELLTHTLASVITRDSPIQNISALAQKLHTHSMVSPATHAPVAQAMNLNNFMLNNNNAATVPSGQSQYAYQNQNRNQYAGMHNGNNNNNHNNGNSNNHSCFKQNNIANTFYGNNVVLNALVNQIGNNIYSINSINNVNNSSAFNSNFMNAINGTNNTNLNQLSNAAVANLVNQNRQQIYGMCRQNINKSGINFNANSHKPMPTYSHF